jgi:Multiple myeloma tumor-associated
MARPGDLYGPPIREASVRGGAGRFNWEDVKKDEKFRDTYIGHSLHAPVGRWQKGKDLQWYARATPSNAADEKARQRTEREAEIRRIKEAEEEALAEALGFKVERKVNGEGVSQEELASALKDEDGGREIEKVEGLGYGRYVYANKSEAEGSVNPRIGASLPDGGVVRNQPPETGRNGVSVEVTGKVDDEAQPESVERDGGERRKHRHRHYRDSDHNKEDRHRRHHRREDEHRHRSRSPRKRRELTSDKERHSEQREDTNRHPERSRRKDRRDRDDSPRRGRDHDRGRYLD